MLFKVQKGGRIAGRRFDHREENVPSLLSLRKMWRHKHRRVTEDDRVL